MSRLEKREILPTLEDFLDRIEKDGTIEVYFHEKDALKQIIEQYGTEEIPMSAYFSLEDWLYEQKDKSIEIKSAMLWGGLWVMHHMKCIDWNTMREMYGEFMSKQMELR